MAGSDCTHTCEVCGVLYAPTKNKDGSVRRVKRHVCSERCRRVKVSRGADWRAVRQCKDCGANFCVGGAEGRPPVRCEECRAASLAKDEKSCERCGTTLGKGRTRWCSTKCRDGTRMNRAEYLESVKARPDSICACCGAEYKSDLGGTSKKRGHVSRFCSRECARNYRSENATPKFSPALLVECKTCSKPFYTSSKLVNRCSDECRKQAARDAAREHYMKTSAADKSARKCKHCGKTFSPVFGDKRRVYCSEPCRDKAGMKARRAKYGTSHRRRARMFGVKYSPVNAIAVFERDGWRCQICGRKTPKRLRGTYHDAAPELDHRIPMSIGGEHSYENTQCACRECNIDKGNKAEAGQLPLFGATPRGAS